MRLNTLLHLLVFIVCAVPVAAAGYESPSPGRLRILRHEHHRKDWLRVTTDSTRWEVRAREFADDGLLGLTARDPHALVPDPIPWALVSRIDLRESRFRYGQVMGFVFGGLLGAAAGGAIGAPQNHGDVGAQRGLVIGMIGGAWLGALRGDQIVSERSLYVARPVPETPGIMAAEHASAEAPSVGVPAGAGHEAAPAAESAPLPAPAASEFAAPSANLLYQLQQLNGGHPRLQVATDSSLLTLRARTIDAFGISGITAAVPDSQVPARIPWKRVGRVDMLATDARRDGVLGFVVLGAVGAGLGNAIGAADDHGGTGTLLGLATVGGLGAWVGSRFGARKVHEENWYVATALEPGAERGVTPVSATPDGPPGAPQAAETASAPADTAAGATPRILRACRQLRPDRLLRIDSDFGVFQGFVGIAGPRGLEELRADLPSRDAAGGVIEPTLLTWDRIQRVRMRDNDARRGAAVGAVAVGVPAGVVAAAFAMAFGGTGTEALGGLGLGFGIGAAAGALVGGFVGAAVPRWRSVYEAL